MQHHVNSHLAEPSTTMAFPLRKWLEVTRWPFAMKGFRIQWVTQLPDHKLVGNE